MTKAFTAALVGIAIAEKKIPSVSTRVLPYFAEDAIGNPAPEKERITIEDLLTMRSGLDHADDRVSPGVLLRGPAGGAVPVLSSRMAEASPPRATWGSTCTCCRTGIWSSSSRPACRTSTRRSTLS